MIKVKKTISLLMIFSIIFSNIVFAQSGSSSPYEGRPIDPSREGEDYYREGDVIVYPAEANSEEKRMMERFAKSEMSEDEMRKIAKSKFGNDFDEMQFKRSMLEVKDRMDRKDAFSYEREDRGQRYYAGPSYEGYSKEQMVFTMVFQHIRDEIDPREIKQYCNDPEKMADIVIGKFREKAGDLQKVCSQAEEQELKCQESSKRMCSQIGMPYARDGATELEKLQSIAHSCPVNKDAIVKACVLRIKSSIEQNIRQASASCEKRFEYEGERLASECSRFKEGQVCERGKYIERCMAGIKKEDFERKCPEYPAQKCNDGMELKSRTDNNGCVYYYCESAASTADTCPPSAIPSCGEGSSLQKKSDERGCASYYCEAARVCPETTTPSCSEGQTLQKKTDDKGCVYYYCEQSCPRMEKTACAEGQSVDAKYDERGCVTSYECVTVTTTSNSITGQVVLSTYEDYLRNCESSWNQQEKSCSTMLESCDKNALIERCRQQSKKGFEEHLSRTGLDCSAHTEAEIRSVEDRCSRMGRERERCLEESSKRCEHMRGVAEKCKETLTEESLRKFIMEETAKRCKFKDIVAEEEDVRGSDKVEIVLAVLGTATEDDISKLELFVEGLEEDLKLQETIVYKGMISPANFGDIKLLPFVVNAKISAIPSAERAKDVKAKIVAGQKVEEAASKLASLRDSDVPSEYLYIIEDEASDVLDVSDNLEEIGQKDGQKGVGYKIRLFLGLAKAAEQEEIKQLDESKAKLSKSIEALARIVDEVPNDVAKAILKEQVENLKKQQEDMEILIETKGKKSKGWFGLFS